jgi:hypothetical protein
MEGCPSIRRTTSALLPSSTSISVEFRFPITMWNAGNEQGLWLSVQYLEQEELNCIQDDDEEGDQQHVRLYPDTPVTKILGAEAIFEESKTWSQKSF